MPQTAKDKRDERRRKGAKSISRKGDMDYTTKRGDKMYHRGGKDVRGKKRPYQRRMKRQKSIRPGGKVRGRTAKPLMTPNVKSVNPPNVYMGGNRASYLAPPPDRVRSKRGGRRMPKY